MVQNGCFADGERTFFVPHWPQPGLRPRDASRQASIRTMAYKGASANLHPVFRSARWRRFLRERGIAWVVDEMDYDHVHASLQKLAWADYTSVDVFVAVRQAFDYPYYFKPASKLANGWLAGVPSLLGPEYAYRELRTSPLDYIEVTSAEAAMQAVDRLLESPSLYRRMVEHGWRRAPDFAHERVTARWAELLFERFPAMAQARAYRLSRHLPLRLRGVWPFLKSPEWGGHGDNRLRAARRKMKEMMPLYENA